MIMALLQKPGGEPEMVRVRWRQNTYHRDGRLGGVYVEGYLGLGTIDPCYVTPVLRSFNHRTNAEDKAWNDMVEASRWS